MLIENKMRIDEWKNLSFEKLKLSGGQFVPVKK